MSPFYTEKAPGWSGGTHETSQEIGTWGTHHPIQEVLAQTLKSPSSSPGVVLERHRYQHQSLQKHRLRSILIRNARHLVSTNLQSSS